jgi:hypothetical protein
MPGHPLRGETLQVDLRVAARSDGFIQVILPDGSRTLLPVEKTDITPGKAAASGRLCFTRDGLRALLLVVEDLSSRS